MIRRKRFKALVVDDGPPMEGLFRLMMAVLDWDLEFSSCPANALSLLKENHFDVVITDYHMPRGNGFHFVCCLRQEGITLPAIVMSQDPEILRLTPKILLNIPAVLLKPFTAADLRAALSAISFS